MTEKNVHTEEFKVSGEKMIAKVKELVHEGNIRRIIIKDAEGKTLIEAPLTIVIEKIDGAPGGQAPQG